MDDSDWEEATEPLPGLLGPNTFELGLDVLRVSRQVYADMMITGETGLPELWPASAAESPGSQVRFVVFEPASRGLAERLRDLGYPVAVAASGVDVMTLVADEPCAAVVCGPMKDAERRRLLTAALKMRFPTVPVVYATSHADNPKAVEGAIREGAQAILPWPLPDDDSVDAVVCGFLRRSPPPSGVQATREKAPRPSGPTSGHEREPVPETIIDRERPPPPVDEDTRATPALERPSELKELLSALEPILWNLNDAARWAEGLARKGDTTALAHASTLHIVARLLHQLKGRLDDE